jgi:hypothetical protein
MSDYETKYELKCSRCERIEQTDQARVEVRGIYRTLYPEGWAKVARDFTLDGIADRFEMVLCPACLREHDRRLEGFMGRK